jgi:four helix bundle protein
MIAEAWARRRYKAAFINKIDEAIGEANETQSWLDDALDAGSSVAGRLPRLERPLSSHWRNASRMIDRADDF